MPQKHPKILVGIEIPDLIIYVLYPVPKKNQVPLCKDGFSDTRCTQAVEVCDLGNSGR